MSLTVRLRGLPLLADAIHIRNFFSGLKIQYGGINIFKVHGMAFVKFTSFRDACYALERSGNLLMNSCIKVSLEEEFQQISPKSHQRSEEMPGYLRISLHPLNATFSDVRKFFKDLRVRSIIFLTKNKDRNGQALVKFVKESHALIALTSELSAENEIGFSVTSVKESDEKEWIKFGGKIDLPPRESRWKGTSRHTSCNKRNSRQSPEFYAHLINVSLCADKRHIRRFLYNLVDDSRIMFVYDKNGFRTRDCFIRCEIDECYTKILSLDKTMLKGLTVRIFPVSKEQMIKFFRSKEGKTLKDMTSEEESLNPSYSAPKARCVYLRNFAADVNKRDVLDFFRGSALNVNDVYLLYGDNGDGLGEALVKFPSEEDACNAEKLNRKKFRGTEVLVMCISEKQLKAFGVRDFGFSSVDGHHASMDKEESLSSMDKEESLSSMDKEESLSSMDKEESLSSMDKEESLSSMDKEESLSSMDNEENWVCVSMEDDTPDITSN